MLGEERRGERRGEIEKENGKLTAQEGGEKAIPRRGGQGRTGLAKGKEEVKAGGMMAGEVESR